MNEVVISNTSMPVVGEFGLLAAPEPFYHPDRVADFNVMVYVTDGTIYVTEDGIDYEINPGELMFLKSGVHHYGKRETERGARWYYAHFYLPGNDCAQLHTQELSLPKKVTVLEKSRVLRLIEKCSEDFYSKDPRRRWGINSKFFEILTELAFMNLQDNIPQSLSERLCAYLTQHCCEPFSAKALEHEFYLSYKYMASVFKAEQRQTMQQYHTSMRMNTACRLLRSTLMSVSEVAAAVGYSDALYFSHCFHAAVGMSPSAYRRNIDVY